MIRRLLQHPRIDLVLVSSIDHVDQPVGAVHLNLDGATDLRFRRVDVAEAAAHIDVALLGLPHEASLEAVPVLRQAGVKVVDMSAAFRLDDAHRYEARYGRAHPQPQLLSEFAYGLPEVHRARIRNAAAVANPGCFASAVQLALWPLATAGALAGPVRVTAMTGSSGAGVEPRPTTHHPLRSVTLRPYAALRHVQSFEMEEQLERSGAADLRLDFVPVSAPLSRGILAVCHCELPADWDEERVAAAFEHAYRDEPFVRLVRGREPEVAAVAGSATAEVAFRVGAARGRTRPVVTFGALDNLIKGGGGQAIQNLNLMLGLDERLTLTDPGSWP
jgi:N-acetyl-gamma-glutamyl-phosphate reductase